MKHGSVRSKAEVFLTVNKVPTYVTICIGKDEIERKDFYRREVPVDLIKLSYSFCS